MNKRLTISFILIVALTLLVAALMIGCGSNTGESNPQTEQTTTAETLGVAYPTLMTYEEYKKLSPQLQQEYYESFPSPELYMDWFNAAVLAYNTTIGEAETNNEGQITQPTEHKNDPQETPATTPTQKPTIPITKPTENDEIKEDVSEPTANEEIVDSDILEGTIEGGTGRPPMPQAD